MSSPSSPRYNRLVTPLNTGAWSRCPASAVGVAGNCRSGLTAYNVVHADERVLRWCLDLHQALAASVRSSEDDQVEFRTLSGDSLYASSIDTLEKWNIDDLSHQPGAENPKTVVLASLSRLIMLAGGHPDRAVGYATFDFRWAAPVRPTDDEATTLQLELNEVWLHPDRRGRGLGALIADAVCEVAVQHLQTLARAAGTLPDQHENVQIEVGADVRSRSGEAFVVLVGERLEESICRLPWHEGLVPNVTNVMARL